jgi:U4/U6 small nuclear ribonucleoprotein PRP4
MRLPKLLQAADRRDRLIYVLSQINAARGDDAMHVDEEYLDESEEDVCILFIY